MDKITAKTQQPKKQNHPARYNTVMKITVIIPAAGIGQRFSKSNLLQDAKSKLEMDLGGKPVFLNTIECFTSRPEVHQILLAVHPDKVDEYKFRYSDTLQLKGAKIIPGSTTERWDTIRLALTQIAPETTHVAIHDAARPLITQNLITQIFTAAEYFDAVIPGLPSSATLKQISSQVIIKQEDTDSIDSILGLEKTQKPQAKYIEKTIDRRNIIEAQTPQIFEVNLIKEAYQKITQGQIPKDKITDDACLLEYCKQRVYVISGESSNLKITTQEDLQLAQALIQIRQKSQAKSLGEKRLFKHSDDDDLF